MGARDTVIEQVGNLDLLRSVKKGLHLSGAAPERIEKMMKVVYICNPNQDPVNVQAEPAFAKVKKVKDSGSAIGADILTRTVTTGKKWLIKKIIVAASNGTTNVDTKLLTIDGNELLDPNNENPATFLRMAPSTEHCFVGDNAGGSETGFTVSDYRICNQIWATRSISWSLINGADNFYFMYIWYEEFPLNVGETAASDN